MTKIRKTWGVYRGTTNGKRRTKDSWIGSSRSKRWTTIDIRRAELETRRRANPQRLSELFWLRATKNLSRSLARGRRRGSHTHLTVRIRHLRLSRNRSQVATSATSLSLSKTFWSQERGPTLKSTKRDQTCWWLLVLGSQPLKMRSWLSLKTRGWGPIRHRRMLLLSRKHTMKSPRHGDLEFLREPKEKS